MCVESPEVARRLKTFGPASCYQVQGIRILGLYAEWPTDPPFSLAYEEEFLMRVFNMVQEDRLTTIVGRSARPTGSAYITKELDCPGS